MIAGAIRTVASTTLDVLPVAIFLFFFHYVVLERKLANRNRIAFGFCLVVVGLGFFLVGLERGLFPLGRLMAEQLTSVSIEQALGVQVYWSDYYWVYLFGFAVGFGCTFAEPALVAVAMKAQAVSGGAVHPWGLRIAVALGVAIGVALGCLRIVTGTPLHWYIIAAYLVVVLQTAFAPRQIVPLAYDSGGVTTSTVTVPLVTALGLGLSEHVPGRNPLLDGFGLIAFACLFPIMSVLAYAQLSGFIEQRRLRRARHQITGSDIRSEED
ncbi:MAG: DUF1538 domain-containing protein [Gammaproteobacteria bacterium]|nr:DUF1538 domain-containing protein [Gammaproteobacteria bacterium]